jgi:cell division transport system permease protein
VDQDLRDLFDRELEDEPVPPPGDLARTAMASGTRLRRRRSLLAGGAAVAVAVLATIVGLNVAAPADQPIPPVAAAAALPQAGRTQPCTLPAQGPTKVVAIFLREDITEAQRSAVYTELTSDPLVRSVRFESREQAFQKFKELWKDDPDFIKSVGAEQLPESFRLTLADPAESVAVVTRYTGQTGISEIVPGECGAHK